MAAFSNAFLTTLVGIRKQVKVLIKNLKTLKVQVESRKTTCEVIAVSATTAGGGGGGGGDGGGDAEKPAKTVSNFAAVRKLMMDATNEIEQRALKMVQAAKAAGALDAKGASQVCVPLLRGVGLFIATVEVAADPDRSKQGCALVDSLRAGVLNAGARVGNAVLQLLDAVVAQVRAAELAARADASGGAGGYLGGGAAANGASKGKAGIVTAGLDAERAVVARTGVLLEACKAARRVPTSNRAATKRAVLRAARMVKDSAQEFGAMARR